MSFFLQKHTKLFRAVRAALSGTARPGPPGRILRPGPGRTPLVSTKNVLHYALLCHLPHVKTDHSIYRLEMGET